MQAPLKRIRLINPIDLVFSHHDILTYKILPHLSPLDFLSLTNSIPAFVNASRVTSKEFFESKLLEMVAYATGSSKHWDLTACITGGFLLAVLFFDKSMLGNDIDIVDNAKDDTEIQSVLCGELDNTLDFDYMFETRISHIYEYKVKGGNGIVKKLQVISLYPEVTPKDYADHFDFEFCANFYSKGKLYVKQGWKELLNRSCTIDVTKYALYRIATRNQFCMGDAVTAAEILRKRIDKYRLRGFNICAKQEHEWWQVNNNLNRIITNWGPTHRMFDTAGSAFTTHLKNVDKETKERLAKHYSLVAIANWWCAYWKSYIDQPRV
jgi:hypothetical protein